MKHNLPPNLERRPPPLNHQISMPNPQHAQQAQPRRTSLGLDLNSIKNAQGQGSPLSLTGGVSSTSTPRSGISSPSGGMGLDSLSKVAHNLAHGMRRPSMENIQAASCRVSPRGYDQTSGFRPLPMATDSPTARSLRPQLTTDILQLKYPRPSWDCTRYFSHARPNSAHNMFCFGGPDARQHA